KGQRLLPFVRHLRHGHTSDAVGLQEQARIPVLKILNRTAQGAPRYDSIRVRNPPITSLGSLYLIGEVEKRETVNKAAREDSRVREVNRAESPAESIIPP